MADGLPALTFYSFRLQTARPCLLMPVIFGKLVSLAQLWLMIFTNIAEGCLMQNFKIAVSVFSVQIIKYH